ncbi:MAG: family 10 glycosylhydrolase [Chlorobi bacterium]|nr:family 10 glycosylhydrolase [Chlorobiota bacterium]
MKKFIFTLSIIVILFSASNAQYKKYEFRAVWVATVANIDWPSKTGLTTIEQKDEVIRILDLHKKNGINAVILQVRPSADAIYKSNFEPWSKYLSGIQGVAPDPLYDPLEFWIQEAHKRGMELHAWFNPYRIKQSLDDSLAVNHILRKHPDWGWAYGNKVYFEPGNPEVWQFVTNVVADVVSRYDIDAVHFDDYFYPYKIAGKEIPDSAAFEQFGGKFYPNKKDDWRRHNVDTVIQKLSIAIKNIKPWVKFGISPFGVWRNSREDPIGSETKAGTTNYDVLYADIIKWQRKGWIDYTMPQLYWRENHPVVDFSTLAYWWNDFSYGRAMYIGLAPYKINKKSKFKYWKNEKAFLSQIDLLRSLQFINGFGYFSSKHFFRKDLSKLNKKTRKKYCRFPAIVPPMFWIDNTAPLAPVNLKLTDSKITWETPEYDSDMNKARFFVIYKYSAKQKKYLKNVINIICITGQTEFILPEKDRKGIYRIASLDRSNNESQLSDIIIVN